MRRHRDWMETEEARQPYRRRAPLIEPLFGILKTPMGAWRFTLRGLAEVAAEWTLLATAFKPAHALAALARPYAGPLDPRPGPGPPTGVNG